MRQSPRFLAAASFAVLLSACNLAPTFHKPETVTPSAFKEQPVEPTADQRKGDWQPLDPQAQKDRGAWWEIFGDNRLNDLEKQALAANQSLKAAADRVIEARDTAGTEAPSILPDLNLEGNAVRAKQSPASFAAFGAPATSTVKPYTLYETQGVADYEVDLFGAIRNNYRAFMHDAAAQQAMYNNVLLSLQADVAQTYFNICALDSERQLLRDTLVVRKKAVDIMQRRFNAGDSTEQELAQTQSDLAGVQADLIGLDRRRATLEHALAVLLGKLPSDFAFAETPLAVVPPAIPAGLPSTLLARRPDVDAALMEMKGANERIGVARAAFFPSLDLTASGGFESIGLGSLFKWSNKTWALGQLAGMALDLPIFDSGRRLAEAGRANAAYDESVANYRQQVLVAFRDVEDSLSDQRLLLDQSKAADTAADTSDKATDLTRKRYDEGDADYTEVVESQRISLAADRAAVETRGERFVTTVALIRALGGGWK